MQSITTETIHLVDLVREFQKVSGVIEYHKAQNEFYCERGEWSINLDNFNTLAQHQKIYPTTGYYAPGVASVDGFTDTPESKVISGHNVVVHDHTKEFLGTEEPEVVYTFENEAHPKATLLWIGGLYIYKIETSRIGRWNELFDASSKRGTSKKYQYAWQHAGDWSWDGVSDTGLIRRVKSDTTYRSFNDQYPHSFIDCKRID